MSSVTIKGAGVSVHCDDLFPILINKMPKNLKRIILGGGLGVLFNNSDAQEFKNFLSNFKKLDEIQFNLDLLSCFGVLPFIKFILKNYRKIIINCSSFGNKIKFDKILKKEISKQFVDLTKFLFMEHLKSKVYSIKYKHILLNKKCQSQKGLENNLGETNFCISKDESNLFNCKYGFF